LVLENAELEFCPDVWKIAERRQKWGILSRQYSIALRKTWAERASSWDKMKRILVD